MDSQFKDVVSLYIDIQPTKLCQDYLSNFHLRGICFARNKHGTASSSFELILAEEFFGSGELKNGNFIRTGCMVYITPRTKILTFFITFIWRNHKWIKNIKTKTILTH